MGLDDILGGMDGHAGTPLVLVATVAETASLDDFRLFALGALANLATLIATVANCFAGPPVFMNSFSLSTNSTSTIHNLTSFGLWFGFSLKKSEIRSLDLTTYPTLLLALRQGQNEKNSGGISISQYALLLFGDERRRGECSSPSTLKNLTNPVWYNGLGNLYSVIMNKKG